MSLSSTPSENIISCSSCYFQDTTVDNFSQRIADKISDHCPNAVLVTIDNKHLGKEMKSHALIVQQNIDGKWRSKDRNAIRLEKETLDALAELIAKKLHKEIVDYDNHLDDISRDFLNVELNMEIDSA